MEIKSYETEFWGSCPSEEKEMLQWIERAGRHSYLSYDRYNNESYKAFSKMIASNGHYSVLGHSNICFCIHLHDNSVFSMLRKRYCLNTDFELYRFLTKDLVADIGHRMSYFRVKNLDNKLYISANLRAFLEYMANNPKSVFTKTIFQGMIRYYPYIMVNIYPKFVDNKENFFKSFSLDNHFELDLEGSDELINLKIELVDETQQKSLYMYDIPQYTFRIVTDRGISHEIVRHTTMTFTQESTRYCNYNKKGLFFMDGLDSSEVHDFYEQAERLYGSCLENGLTPQFARNILPHALKTEMVMTGRLSAFGHFVNLRTGKTSHPTIRYHAMQIRDCLREHLGGFFDKGSVAE